MPRTLASDVTDVVMAMSLSAPTAAGEAVTVNVVPEETVPSTESELFVRFTSLVIERSGSMTTVASNTPVKPAVHHS